MPSLSVERDTEILIDNQLKNLGWNNDPHAQSRNVYQQRVKTEEQRKRLQGKKPDYILYRSNSNDPIAIIEAKKQGRNIHDALRQGIEYAEKLNTNIVFATDGVFTKTLHIKSNKPLLLNGEEIDELIRETLALKYLSTNEVNTLDKKVIKSRSELVSIFSTVNDLLREEGLQQGLDRFIEFSNILFLKVLSEIEDAKEEQGEALPINKELRWNYFRSMNGHGLLNYVSDTVLKSFSKKYQDDNIFQPLQIRHPDNLIEIIKLLDGLQLTDINVDIKGDAFEHFIRSYSASNPSDLGEIFTPRHVVKTMVKLLNPQIGETVYDPFCGTGGMLIVAYKHIMDSMSHTPRNIETLQKETVYGADITKTASIAKMNMILAGDGHSNIVRHDSLAEGKGKYDVVLTNMPFAQKTRYGDTYPIPHRKGNIICPQHCLRSLTDNGRMAMIVPEGFLTNSEKSYQDVRRYLLENANLKSVISLPKGVFEPYNGVKTDILLFNNHEKKKTEKYFWYFDVKNDGYTLDKKRRKINGQNDLELVLSENNLVQQKQNYLLSNRISKIEIEKVKNNNWNLAGNVYRENKNTAKANEEIKLGEIVEFQYGYTSVSQERGAYRFIRITDIDDSGCIHDNNVKYVDVSEEKYEKYQLNHGDILVARTGSYGKTTIFKEQYPAIFASYLIRVRFKTKKIIPEYYWYFAQSDYYWNQARNLVTGTSQPQLNANVLKHIRIPLPSIEVQQQLAQECDGYRKVIVGARQIIENWSPTLEHDKRWETLKIGDCLKLEYGKGLPESKRVKGDYPVVGSNGIIGYHNEFIVEGPCIIIGRKGSAGEVSLIEHNAFPIDTTFYLRWNAQEWNTLYLFYYLKSLNLNTFRSGTAIPGMNRNELYRLTIQKPPIDIQNKIAQNIEKERQMVTASKEILHLFEQKIKTRLDAL